MSTKITQNSIALKMMVYVLKSQRCLSFTLNPNQSLLYIQGNENLFILQLFCKMGQIKKHRQLFNKIGSCSALLLFMKKSNQFVTAAFGKLIFLWEFDFALGWKFNKFIQGHERTVTCLILNNIEDQLISGSLDSTLRFWNKADNWKCKQTIVVDNMQILSICLNQTETKLIAYGSQRIIILEFEKNWSVIQEIKTEEGNKLCFLNEKTFIFLSDQGNLIKTYKYDEQDLLFKQHKIIQVTQSVESYVEISIKYIEKQNLILVQSGKLINLIKYTEQEEFIILQQIQFIYETVVETISDDARYLITWEKNDQFENFFESNQIQIRMLKQFN